MTPKNVLRKIVSIHTFFFQNRLKYERNYPELRVIYFFLLDVEENLRPKNY